MQRLHAGDVVDTHARTPGRARPCTRGPAPVLLSQRAARAALPLFHATVLWENEHLFVADKPHFLPVIPSGKYLHETLLVRLKKSTGIDTLSPVHRIDRDTAGLVLFAKQPSDRARLPGPVSCAQGGQRCMNASHRGTRIWPGPHAHQPPSTCRALHAAAEKCPAAPTPSPILSPLRCARVWHATGCARSPASATSCACTWLPWVCPSGTASTRC